MQSSPDICSYLNEDEVGAALRDWLGRNKSVKRKDIFITTKVRTTYYVSSCPVRKLMTFVVAGMASYGRARRRRVEFEQLASDAGYGLCGCLSHALAICCGEDVRP